ncbi:MAG: alpha/beta fold hydrolase [Thermodesulfobacteriota bacterium]
MEFNETSHEIFKTSDNVNLLIRSWLPDDDPKAVILAIHGGMAHGGDYVTPALYFKDKNIATFAPDLRWHGTYPKHNKNGKVVFHINSYNQYAQDIHEIYTKIKKRYPDKPIFIMSHSNGSLISLYYGLTIGQNSEIAGYIVSSPWLSNKVQVPLYLKAASKIIAKVMPGFAIEPEPLTEHLTHDKDITKRHYADENSGLRATKVSAKLGVESEKTQKFVLDNIAKWDKFPVYAFIAGNDYLADPDVSEAALKRIPGNLVKIKRYNKNFHENYNEINRDEIFDNISRWMETLAI